MTGAAAESWARLRLVQGDSSAQVWELVASRGQTTLTVGSGPSSSWVIREEGVRPLHFSLHWDGATLRIADTYGAGDVRVDGTPVTAQWKSLIGRARIDFGRAAMVAETSAGAESEGHPLEPSPLPPAPAHNTATLLGVMADPPVELVTPKADSTAPKASESLPPANGQLNDGTGSFRVARPTDSERARKATLVGMVISAPPPAPVPEMKMSEGPRAPESAASAAPSAPPAGASAAPAPAAAGDEPKRATPPRGIPSGTLIGVVGPLEARVQRLAQDGNSKLSDKRTMLGVPLRDLRIEPPPAASPSGDLPGIVTQAEVRAVTTTPVAGPPAERIGSTWQEIPGAARPGGSQPPMAVLVDPPSAGQRRVENEAAARTVSDRPPGFDPRQRGGFDPRASAYDRVSDIPTQMRDVASLDSRRPKRTIPLRYIGIVVLTAAAYLAWLYLLDHL
jgi:hypothetical protein